MIIIVLLGKNCTHDKSKTMSRLGCSRVIFMKLHQTSSLPLFFHRNRGFRKDMYDCHPLSRCFCIKTEDSGLVRAFVIRSPPVFHRNRGLSVDVYACHPLSPCFSRIKIVDSSDCYSCCLHVPFNQQTCYAARDRSSSVSLLLLLPF